MSLPPIDSLSSKGRRGLDKYTIILIALVLSLPFTFLAFLMYAPSEVVERYKAAWVAANIRVVNAIGNVLPAGVRTSILFNSLFDSDVAYLQFNVRSRKYRYRLGVFKKCFAAKDDICSSSIRINKNCLMTTLEKLKPFKQPVYYMSGAGRKVEIRGTDLSFDIEGTALILAKEISNFLGRVCKVGLSKPEHVKLTIPVKFSTGSPNTRGEVSDKYVEIDYSRQFMFLWIKGTYKRFKISGPVDQNYVLGVYKIYSKSKLAWSEPYRAWMPFWLGYTRDKYSGLGVGIHALTYSCYNKSKYCSSKYRVYEPPSVLGKPVSDGCVRLSTNDAREVFKVLDIGDIVVVHK